MYKGSEKSFSIFWVGRENYTIKYKNSSGSTWRNSATEWIFFVKLFKNEYGYQTNMLCGKTKKYSIIGRFNKLFLRLIKQFRIKLFTSVVLFHQGT